MATEKFANAAATALAANYTAGSGSVQVTSTGSPFPSSPQFRIGIFDVSTGSLKVLLKVTAITDGTHWAVTAEGSDANANSTDIVELVLTAGAMNQIIADDVSLSTFAGATASEKAGRVQLYSDMATMARDNGATFDPFGPMWAFTDPNLTSFSWRNQGAATVTQRGQTLYLTAPHNATSNLRGREIAQPSRPYTITACFIPHMLVTNFHNFGLYICDNATGKIVQHCIASVTNLLQMQCAKLTNVTTFSAAYIQIPAWFCSPMWLRILDDGTNFTFSWSTNGVDFAVLSGPVSRTDWLAAPSHVGWFADTGGNNAWDASVTLLSWKQT